MAKLKGRGIVWGADGTVTVAGVAQINTTTSADVSDASEVTQIKDSSGRVQTLVVAESIRKVSVELTPGGDGATVAAAVTQAALPGKLDSIELSGFDVDAFNGKWIIVDDSSVKLTSGGAATLSIKGTRFERDFTADAVQSI